MIDIPDSFLAKDENGVLLCPKCHKTLSACTCPSFDPTKPKVDLFTPLVRLEKKGRKGKTVTLIERLPTDEDFLKELAKMFKARIGGGGTYYVEADGGVIEVQGDHRSALTAMLADQGFRERLNKGKR